MNVRDDYAHGTGIEYLLHESQAALVRYSDERGDAGRVGGEAKLASIAYRERGVLEIDKQRVVAGGLCNLDNLAASNDLDAKSRADLALGSQREEIVRRDVLRYQLGLGPLGLI